MADNFDLRKFLKENKALENLNPTIKSLNETSFSDKGNTQDYGSSPTERPDGTYDISNIMKETLKARIKEMIIAELGDPDYSDYDEMEDMPDIEGEDYESVGVYGDNYDDDFDPRLMEADAEGGFLEEAKKDEEEVEVTDTETEEVPAEDAPADEAPAEEAPAAGGGGLEDIAADMEGTEGDLMDHLMSALKVAKGMNNEKLTTQIGNTLKFFVSEYIGGEEQ